MVKTCGECNWFTPAEPVGSCRAHTYIGETTKFVIHALTGAEALSCHKFREGEKKNQLVNDNWERGGSWHAHSQDH